MRQSPVCKLLSYFGLTLKGKPAMAAIKNFDQLFKLRFTIMHLPYKLQCYISSFEFAPHLLAWPCRLSQMLSKLCPRERKTQRWTGMLWLTTRMYRYPWLSISLTVHSRARELNNLLEDRYEQGAEGQLKELSM